MQEFEKHEKLKNHIQAMALTGTIGNSLDWSDFLYSLNEALSASSERAGPAKVMPGQKPVHWRAVLSADELIHQPDASRHVVGFTKLSSAEEWIASKLDFESRNYKLEPLFRHPLSAQSIPEGYTLAPVEPTPEMLDAGVAMALQVSVHGKGG